MNTVRQLLDGRHRVVWATIASAPCREALGVMMHNNISALPVLASTTLVGIITERDFARKVCYRENPETPLIVGDVMTCNVISVRLTQTVEECMALMIEKHIRHLPVVDDGMVVGMLSMRDLIKDVLADKEFTIEQMTRYIAG